MILERKRGNQQVDSWQDEQGCHDLYATGTLMQQKGFQCGSKEWEAGEGEQPNGNIRDIDCLKESSPMQRKQYSLPEKQEAIMGSLRAQGNVLKPAERKKHETGKESAPKDDERSRQGTQFAQNPGKAKKEDGNVSKYQSSQLIRLLWHKGSTPSEIYASILRSFGSLSNYFPA
jgi:hypothetical protein